MEKGENMKLIFKLMLMGMMFFITSQSNAQFGSAACFPVIAGDSLVTADSVFKLISVTAGYNALGVQVSVKKASGTLDGKLYLYKSIGGTNYVLSDSASLSAVPTAALISNGGYTHTAIIEKVAPAGSKYLAVVTQTGSLTASPTKFCVTSRKYN